MTPAFLPFYFFAPKLFPIIWLANRLPMGIHDSGQCDWRVLRSLGVKDLFCRYRGKRVGPSQPLQKTYFLFPTLHTFTVAVKCHCPGSDIPPGVTLPRECHCPGSAIPPGVSFPRECHSPGSAIAPGVPFPRHWLLIFDIVEFVLDLNMDESLTIGR